jgi:threonine dehydrogenase-like Zn-dependent dehydrogenase
MAKDTMKAVVFKGPYKVAIEDRPIPRIQDATDIIVKVDKACLELRYYQIYPNYHIDGAVRQVQLYPQCIKQTAVDW